MKLYQYLFVLLLLISSFQLFSQNQPLKIDSDYDLMYCPRTNGEIQNNQEIELTILGPDRDKLPPYREDWYASYSVNGGPPVKLNDGNAITSADFELVLSFDNLTVNPKDISIRIVSARRKDYSTLPISTDETENTANFKILPKPEPYFKDHNPAAKKNTTQVYTAIFNKHSKASVSVTEGANLLGVTTSEINSKKEVAAEVKWPDLVSDHSLKIVEMDPLGCESDTIFSPVKIVDAFSVDLGADKHVCNGHSVTITASPNLAGDYDYLWSPTNEKTKKITVSDPGDYTVYVTEKATGTIVNATTHVFIENPPEIDIDDHIIIDGGQVTLDISEPGASYIWSDGTTEGTNTINATGNYSVQKTCQYGCIANKSFKTKLRSDVFTIDMPDATAGCGNNNIIINPTISPSLAYTYLWSNNEKTKAIQVNQEGIYTITVTDPDGFKQSASTRLRYYPMPIVDLGEDKTLWKDETLTLDAGTPGSTYLWSTGETSQYITVSSGGNFSVEVTDVNGCQNSDNVTIEYKSGHYFGVYLGEDQSICQGDSVLVVPDIEGNPSYPLTYDWVDLNHTEKEIYLKTANNHCVNITDANGNTESGCITITSLPAPTVNLGEDIVSLPNQSITLDAGNEGATYEWSTTEITQKIEISKDGEYWVKVTNSDNCTASDTIKVDVQDDYPFVGIPKAFTPNGDGQNDELIIRYADSAVDIEFMIFNRLGTKVFETRNKDEHWDGSFNGKPQDMDAYIYVLTITYPNEEKKVKKGSFVLLR